MDDDAFRARAGDVRMFESSADLPVRAVVDASGRLVGLSLRPRLLHGSPEMVARMIVEAVTEAQDAATAGHSDTPTGAEAVPREPVTAARQELANALAVAELEAERRLSELRVLVSDLIRNAHGR
jgi:hypothetical protein